MKVKHDVCVRKLELVSVQSKNLQVSFGLCFGFKSKLFKFRVAFAFSAGNRIRAQRKTRVDRECSNKPR